MSVNSNLDRAAQRSIGRPRKGLWRGIGQSLIDVGLWTLGILGLLSLLGAIVAHLWGLSIILFSTGSMSPTITAGSASLVQLIPASEVRVGDVVTVERQDALPVTHRVTSIKPVDSASSTYAITMKGDANEVEDANPYQVSEVRRVLYSVPGVATSINKLRDPRVLAGLTVIAGVLVTWAFWPRGGRKAARVLQEDAEPGDLAVDAGDRLRLMDSASVRT